VQQQKVLLGLRLRAHVRLHLPGRQVEQEGFLRRGGELIMHVASHIRLVKPISDASAVETVKRLCNESLAAFRTGNDELAASTLERAAIALEGIHEFSIRKRWCTCIEKLALLMDSAEKPS
jgi:hypothetical protein